MFQQDNFLPLVFLFIACYLTTAKIDMKNKNCYQNIGISTDATAHQIKKAFRKLALKYHPDKASNKEEAEKHEEIFKELAHCYEILSNEKQRAMYDANGYREMNGGGSGGSSHFSQEQFSDIFSRFFGKGNSFGFEDMFSDSGGSASSFFFSNSNGRKSNPGFGNFGGGGFDPFGSANGDNFGRQNSKQNQRQKHGYQQQTHQQSKKQKMKAKKTVINVELEDILQSSKRSVVIQSCNQREKCNKKTVTINIPKGCPNEYSFKKYGQEFEILTNEHLMFERGNKLHRSDLYMVYDITLEQALLGFDLDIVTIDGEEVILHLEEMPINSQYIVRRKGLPRFKSDNNDQNRGHLIVKFHVLYPVLNEQQKYTLTSVLENDEWNYDKSVQHQKKELKKKQRRRKRSNKPKRDL